MKSLVRKLNNLFIGLILVVMYILIIGLSALIFRLEKLIHGKKKDLSYWNKAKKMEYSADYFKSAF